MVRAADVHDISNRLITNLSGNFSIESDSDEKAIICASVLAPSETVALDKDKGFAFVTVHGSSNSHTAILARHMNIPAIIGADNEFLSGIKDGDEAIVDCYTGEIFVTPDEETRSKLVEKQRADKKVDYFDLKPEENTARYAFA